MLYDKNRLQTQNRLQNRVANSQNFLAALRAARFSVSFHDEKGILCFPQEYEWRKTDWIFLLGNSFYFCFSCAPDHLVCSLDWFSETAVLSLTVLAQE